MINTIITLVNNALFDKKRAIGDDVDWKKVYSFAQRQQITALVYYGLRNSKAEVPAEVLQRFEQAVFMQVMLSENQIHASQAVMAAFDAAGIRYMSLKGLLMKAVYPRPEMRQMSDTDILIDATQTAAIEEQMRSLGFEYQYTSDHEIVWSKPPSVHIELHTRMIPSYNKDFYAYYGDGWVLAQPTEGSTTAHHLKETDNYIYMFTHFAKHYRDAGVGIKHVVDLYLLQNTIDDMKYVERELKKLQLLTFHRNVQRMLHVWFEEGEGDAVTDTIAYRLFAGDAYGTADAHVLSDAVKQSKVVGSSWKAVLQRRLAILFPPISTLQDRYPVLEKAPVLLPIMWICRWVTAVLYRGDNVQKQKTTFHSLKTERVDAYQQELHYVGLDFHFGK